MKITYTRRRSGFEAGKHYRNPRYFDRPERGATSVELDGHYPDIASAYEAVGIPVDKPAQAPQADTLPKPQAEAEQPADEPTDSDSKPKRGRPRKSQE